MSKRPFILAVLLFWGGCFVPAALEAGSIVDSVNVYPRWPWNGKVDIVYVINDSEGNPDTQYDMAFQMKRNGTVLKMNHVEGTMAGASDIMATDRINGADRHVLVWDAGSEDGVMGGKFEGVTRDSRRQGRSIIS